MIGRRGFLGALTGMPIAAVVVPKVSIPEVTASPVPTMVDEAHRHCARFFANGARNNELTITISCNTKEFQRELEKAQLQFESIRDRLTKALHRGIRVERT